MTKIVEKDGKKYLIIGDKAIPYELTDKDGKPIIKVRSEETKNEKGGTDIKVFIPSLKVVGENKSIDENKIINN